MASPSRSSNASGEFAIEYSSDSENDEIPTDTSNSMTPTLLRGNVERAHRSEAMREMDKWCKQDLLIDFIAFFYLSSCLAIIDSKPLQNCDFTTQNPVFWFVAIILWPSLTARALGYYAFYNSQHQRLTLFNFLLSIYWNITYGLWTYYQIFYIFKARTVVGNRCSLRINWTDINFELVIIFGVFPAFTLFSAFLVSIVCCPIWTYECISRRRR